MFIDSYVIKTMNDLCFVDKIYLREVIARGQELQTSGTLHSHCDMDKFLKQITSLISQMRVFMYIFKFGKFLNH